MKQKLDTEKIKEMETIAKELDAEKLRLSAVSKSVCNHSWMNTGMSVQGMKVKEKDKLFHFYIVYNEPQVYTVA